MKIEVFSPDRHTMYLGTALHMRDKHGEELRNRVAKAWAKFPIYREQFVDKDTPVKHWLQLLDLVATPTILYGCGCWAMINDRRHQLKTVQRRMLRMILGAKRKYLDDQGTVESYVEWIQRATHEAEDMMRRYGARDRAH